MKQSKGSISAGKRLAEILEIVKEQRAFLARGDLDAVQELQARRQQLLPGGQFVDEAEGGPREILSEILRLDREMGCLLSMELLTIKEQMKTVASLRKLIRSRLPSEKRLPPQLSQRV